MTDGLLQYGLEAISPRIRVLLGESTRPALVAYVDENLSLDHLGNPLEISDLPVDEKELTNYLRDKIATYKQSHQILPQYIVIAGLGKLLVGQTVAEIQQYKSKVENSESAGGSRGKTGRMTGKVALVTGAAQGFGIGIAEQLLANGAVVILADINLALATKEAERISKEYGSGSAVALQINVGDEHSCLEAASQAVKLFGGIDLYVSNAGVLRAESVITQPVADFDLVTNVNYRGYFLTVRAFAPIMAAQNDADETNWLDIVEVNSKSGIEGSKKNFAYSGSKFGGIGLTQSFALELVEHRIKVNAVCPGNFLDGPLWMDPEKGLFVQYLNANKVPGATTVADVRRFYEQKVPMNRGCTPLDVARAIMYAVEQDYETGQALPVTGGQNMLS